MSKWSDVKIYDLSIPIGILTPPWPTYEPMQMKFFKRLAPNGANGQLVTHVARAALENRFQLTLEQRLVEIT